MEAHRHGALHDGVKRRQRSASEVESSSGFTNKQAEWISHELWGGCSKEKKVNFKPDNRVADIVDNYMALHLLRRREITKDVFLRENGKGFYTC